MPPNCLMVKAINVSSGFTRRVHMSLSGSNSIDRFAILADTVSSYYDDFSDMNKQKDVFSLEFLNSIFLWQSTYMSPYCS